jgi:6-phosphofructokinase 2
MPSIVTLTLNPSIDGSSETEIVRPTKKIRTTNERYHPGGGGINVSRVIRELGSSSLAFYMAGGATGSVLDDMLSKTGIESRRIAIEDHTRISHTVFENSTGLEYRFVPEGPHVSVSEWKRCLADLSGVKCQYLVASGSLPRGVPTGFYGSVAEAAREMGAKLVLDTSGPALGETLRAGGVYLAKPSLGEFEQLVGQELREPDAQVEAAMRFVESGCVEILAVTMGHEGALLAQASGILRLPAIEATARSAVGAGDSFVGAMTLALSRGEPPEDAFRWGIAAGTAAILTPGTELCRRADVERFYRQFPDHT